MNNLVDVYIVRRNGVIVKRFLSIAKAKGYCKDNPDCEIEKTVVTKNESKFIGE